jgi:hypothetical protein
MQWFVQLDLYRLQRRLSICSQGPFATGPKHTEFETTKPPPRRRPQHIAVIHAGDKKSRVTAANMPRFGKMYLNREQICANGRRIAIEIRDIVCREMQRSFPFRD